MTKNRFSAEYETLPDYILGITERIWEGRGLDLIRRYYSEDCWVMTPAGIVTGVEPVITGTQATLDMFPDRELLGEDVIWADHGTTKNTPRGRLSSHRIMSPMTHAGDGMFGKATGRQLYVRTIADCLVVGDVITEEWLVRDQGAIAVQIGSTSEALGRAFAEMDAAASKPAWQLEKWAEIQAGTPEPHAFLQPHPAAVMARETLHTLFQPEAPTLEAIATAYDRAVNLHLPEGREAGGWKALLAFTGRFRQAFPDLMVVVDHSIALQEPGRPLRTATRWRLAGTHDGEGPYGAPTGTKVQVLGINHAEIVNGRITREFWLVDETAIWRQIAGKVG